MVPASLAPGVGYMSTFCSCQVTEGWTSIDFTLKLMSNAVIPCTHRLACVMLLYHRHHQSSHVLTICDMPGTLCTLSHFMLTITPQECVDYLHSWAPFVDPQMLNGV